MSRILEKDRIGLEKMEERLPNEQKDGKEVRAGQDLKSEARKRDRERHSWRAVKRRSAQLIEMQGTCRLQLHLSNHHF